MIELRHDEEQYIQDNMSYLENNDYEGFFRKADSRQEERIKAFMYENLEIDTYKYQGSVLNNQVFGYHATYLPEVYTVPDSIKHISQDTFYYVINLKKVIIPDTVESIDERAFYGCSNLEEIVFPNNPNYDYVKPYTVRDCGNIKKIWIPDSVIELTAGSFDCRSIQTKGKYMFAHWREDPEKQISIRESDVPVFREHFQFVD